MSTQCSKYNTDIYINELINNYNFLIGMKDKDDIIYKKNIMEGDLKKKQNLKNMSRFSKFT